MASTSTPLDRTTCHAVARGRRLRRVGRQITDAITTKPPESLKGKPFPVVVGPGLDCRCTKTAQQLGEPGGKCWLCRASYGCAAASRRSRITHLRVRQSGVSAPLTTRRRGLSKSIRLGNVRDQSSVGPDGAAIRNIAIRQSAAREPQQGILLFGTWSEVFFEYIVQFRESNSPPRQCVPIPVLRQIRLAAENLGPFLHRLVKRQMLKRMHGIMMNKYRDRSLGR